MRYRLPLRPDGAPAPHLVLSVDPGARKVAAAIYVVDPAAVLVDAVEATARTPRGLGAAVARGVKRWVCRGPVVLVSEWPRSYPGRHAVERDLQSLRATVRAVEVAVGAVVAIPRHRRRRVVPSAWKGAIPKPIHHARVRPYLTPDEATLWDALTHDGRDAAALGLWAVGRTGRGGVAPRGAVRGSSE